MEDSSRDGSLKFLAAVNGACAGGGYELALACDEIVMVDDRSSTVSLPEVPLLGVLPGTGGLTRLIDKRKVRRDLADVFCTTAEGVRADRAKAWNLVDEAVPPARFAETVKARAEALAQGKRPAARCEGRGSAAARAPHRRGGLSLPLRRCRIRPRGGHGLTHSPRSEPVRGSAFDDPGTGRALVAAGHGARARRRDPDAARQRAVARHYFAAHARRTRCRAGERQGDAGACGKLVRARDDRLSPPHARPVRRFLAQPVRHRRSRLVLRGHARGTHARRRPHLHACGRGRWRQRGAAAHRRSCRRISASSPCRAA